jgi:hypothetical protein
VSGRPGDFCTWETGLKLEKKKEKELKKSLPNFAESES